MRRTLLSATLAGLLLLTACGDDEESSGSDSTEQDADGSGSDDESSDDGSDVSVGDIPGVSEDCEAVLSVWTSLYAGLGANGGEIGDVEGTIDALQDVLPDDLDDDAVVFGAAVSQYFAVLKEHADDGDAIYTDPEVQAALQGLGAEEFVTASDNINAYFEESCPAAG